MSEVGTGELKCHRCPVCDGYGCPGMLPGLGGVFEGKNFQLNCEGWKELSAAKKEEISKIKSTKSEIIAELSAYIRNNGSLSKKGITLTTENKFL